MPKKKLISFEFMALCTITFLALCNVSVFFNFHIYLQHIGFRGREAGFIIGLYSVAAMVLYVTASRHVRVENAFACMAAGMLMVGGCGAAYLYADSFWPLALVRISNGAGVFLIMAACMVLLVHIIPPDRTGLAFSLYSVALLSPYAIMPAVAEIALPAASPPTGLYLATAGLLLPALGFVILLRRRIPKQAAAGDTGGAPRIGGGEWRNLSRKPVIAILLVNAVYFTIFSALFFLFKGLGLQRGMTHPGLFFTVQMAVMIVIRMFGGRIFDMFPKAAMVSIALLITGVGFILLLRVQDPAWILPVSAVFGVGMGMCVPPLNSLMYLVTTPQYRGYNANMMMLSVHVGTFMGPFVGAWIIEAGGYDRFLAAAALITTAAAGFMYTANPAKYIPKGADTAP